MIALLNGRIISKSPNELVIDVSGVGYHIYSTLSTFEKLPDRGENVTLFIYTYVREDTLSLYGFITPEEKQLFTKLIKINGIGPRLALSILSGLPPEEFVSAVANDDIARLNAIPGIGRKTAERIILDLKDKLIRDGLANLSQKTMLQLSSTYDDALSALVNLGYKKPYVERALGKIGIKKDSQLTEVIKNALKELTGQ